jgi:hypothetical protein
VVQKKPQRKERSVRVMQSALALWSKEGLGFLLIILFLAISIVDCFAAHLPLSNSPESLLQLGSVFFFLFFPFFFCLLLAVLALLRTTP